MVIIDKQTIDRVNNNLDAQGFLRNFATGLCNETRSYNKMPRHSVEELKRVFKELDSRIVKIKDDRKHKKDIPVSVTRGSRKLIVRYRSCDYSEEKLINYIKDKGYR